MVYESWAAAGPAAPPAAMARSRRTTARAETRKGVRLSCARPLRSRAALPRCAVHGGPPVRGGGGGGGGGGGVQTDERPRSRRLFRRRRERGGARPAGDEPPFPGRGPRPGRRLRSVRREPPAPPPRRALRHERRPLRLHRAIAQHRPSSATPPSGPSQGRGQHSIEPAAVQTRFTHFPTPPAAPSASLRSGSSSYWKRLGGGVERLERLPPGRWEGGGEGVRPPGGDATPHAVHSPIGQSSTGMAVTRPARRPVARLYPRPAGSASSISIAGAGVVCFPPHRPGRTGARLSRYPPPRESTSHEGTSRSPDPGRECFGPLPMKSSTKRRRMVRRPASGSRRVGKAWNPFGRGAGMAPGIPSGEAPVNHSSS